MIKKLVILFTLGFTIALFYYLLSPLPCYSEITFTDVTSEAGVTYNPQTTWGCSMADINSDGYTDIFIPNHFWGNPFIYLNNGNGTFSEAAAEYGLLRSDIVTPDRTSTEDNDFHGSAWGDFDNDGDVDLYIACGAAGGVKSTEDFKNNHFIRNDGATFTQITDQAGVNDLYGRGRTPVWADYDSDGYLDLLVTDVDRPDAPTRLFHNNGNGTFTDATEAVGLYDLLNAKAYDKKGFSAAVFGDYDQDGDADLFMTASYKGSPLIFRNNGNGTFTDVTSEAGINITTTEWQYGSGIVLGDYDNDGDLDLFITQGVDQQAIDCNDGAPACDDSNSIPKPYIKYWTSLPSATTEQYIDFKTTGNQVTFNIGLYGYEMDNNLVFIGQGCQNPSTLPFTLNEGEAYGEPQDCQDVVFRIWQDEVNKQWHIHMKQSDDFPIINNNRTGWITSNITGNGNGTFSHVATNMTTRWNIGNKFRSFLYSNNGYGTFTDVTHQAFGVIFKNWSSSATWADFDNDGYLDLYIVNFTPFDYAPNSFYHNNGDGTFTEMADSAGIRGTVSGRGDIAIVGDYNNDGFLDIFLTNSQSLGIFGNYGPYILYKNNGNNNNWLEIKTRGTLSNRDGIGAKVWVTTGDRTQYQEQNGGTTLFGQNSTLLHIGLGSSSVIDRLKVEWPSGKAQELSNVAVNQILTLIEPGVTWSDVISAYNEYVSGTKTWQAVIATYQLYVKSQV